jgi:ABC-type multidrug transport system ATPase subunit
VAGVLLKDLQKAVWMMSNPYPLKGDMQISLTNTGKRFNREWIFRGFSYEFAAPEKYAVTGPNGSGKSTLLQVVAGSLTHSEGTVQFANGQGIAAAENHFKYVSVAAPYLELIEEMTANEFLAFHTQFKPLNIPAAEALQIINLSNAADKQIRYYSSGMKQRLKLAQAFFSTSPVLLLDEPTTNLDREGVELYLELIQNYTANKLVIISSNVMEEYQFCDKVISIKNYKQV